MSSAGARAGTNSFILNHIIDEIIKNVKSGFEWYCEENSESIQSGYLHHITLYLFENIRDIEKAELCADGKIVSNCVGTNEERAYGFALSYLISYVSRFPLINERTIIKILISDFDSEF